MSDDALAPDALSAYLDGELTDPEREAVEAQLTDSPAWRAELADVRSAREALRGLPEREAPPGFWEAVHAAVAADGEGAAPDDADVVPIAQARSSRERSRWGWVAAGAAAVAAVVAVVVIPHRDGVKPNVTAVVAQHGAQGSGAGDPVGMLAPVGPLAGFRR
jgi:anti-sigma factor RsiW